MKLGGLWTLLNRKYYVDEVYSATIVRFSIWFASFNALIDRYLVDGVVNGVGIASEGFSRVNRWVDTHIVDGTVNLVGIVNLELSRGLKPLQTRPCAAVPVGRVLLLAVPARRRTALSARRPRRRRLS